MTSIQIDTTALGPAGTGSKSFLGACLHSNGKIYVGTYGPPPALIWEFNPVNGDLRQIAAPGEYQLRCLVEGPDGNIYIGTAYSGLVYRLDPDTGEVTTVGTPPMDSTPWIFWMRRARSGKLYGARGVGLFELDVPTGAMRSLGLVPGEHRTPLPGSSNPIVRCLHELPDGSLLGDTNRCLFRCYPAEGRIETIVDMVSFDEGCYALVMPFIHPSDGTMIFPIAPRFSGRKIASPFYRWDMQSNRVTAVDIAGWDARENASHGWVGRNAEGAKVLRLPALREGRRELVEIDLDARRVLRSYTSNPGGVPIDEAGIWWLGGEGIVRFDEANGTFVPVASNPTPAPTRCLAAAPDGTLGADTFDLGVMFTFDPGRRVSTPHGKVWADDHRCNFGPAVFDASGRYFLCNHGQATPKLFVTDVHENRSWAIGQTAMSLLACNDGTVWGVEGASVDTVDHFIPAISWTWQQQQDGQGSRCFRWKPGDAVVEIVPDLLLGGHGAMLAELMFQCRPCLLICSSGYDAGWVLMDLLTATVLHRGALSPSAWAVTSTSDLGGVFLIGEGGHLLMLSVADEGTLIQEMLAADFGTGARGFFHLPGPDVVLSIESDGGVNGYWPATKEQFHAKGPLPLPAGPAVDRINRCWYFSGEEILRYELADTARLHIPADHLSQGSTAAPSPSATVSG